PRTCRSMGPRLTVSVHTVLRSTSGAAGFNLETPIVTPPRHTKPTIPQMICLRRFCCLNSGRAMSMGLQTCSYRAIPQFHYLIENSRPQNCAELRIVQSWNPPSANGQTGTDLSTRVRYLRLCSLLDSGFRFRTPIGWQQQADLYNSQCPNEVA